MALLEQVARGHSPSARLLCNTSDAIVGLSLAVPPQVAPSGLRDRLLNSLQKAPSAPQAKPIEVEATVPPCDVMCARHQADPTDLVRKEATERLHAYGLAHPRGKALSPPWSQQVAEQDEALRVLLGHLAAFVTFEVLFVSCLYGDAIVHRVHQGFPEAMGNVDVVPRELSFCTHSVSAGVPLVVEDVSSEAFFRRGSLVKTGASAYLGVPLAIPGDGGKPVFMGALCCVSGTPRSISDCDVRLQALLARRAQAIVCGDLRACLDDDSEWAQASEARESLTVYEREFFASLVSLAKERASEGAKAYLFEFDADRVAAGTVRLSGRDVVGRVSPQRLGVVVPGPIADSDQARASVAAQRRLLALGPVFVQTLSSG